MNATVRRLTKHAERDVKKTSEDQPDVIVTRPFMGLCAMQACVKKGQSDKDILSLVNQLNPCGTSNGWMKVVHKGDKKFKNAAPVQCLDYTDREHVIIVC